VLQQPLTLRDLHHAIRAGMQRTGHLPKKTEGVAESDD
jgi:hypothetical protein